jgi:hypothetical protein
MKVYIAIGKGGYDDECIEAVFIDKDKAEEYEKNNRIYRIEEWDATE